MNVPEQYDDDRQMDTVVTLDTPAQASGATLTRFVWIGGEFIEVDAVETGDDGEGTR